MIALLPVWILEAEIIDSDRYFRNSPIRTASVDSDHCARGSMLGPRRPRPGGQYPSFSVLLLRDAPGQVERYSRRSPTA